MIDEAVSVAADYLKVAKEAQRLEHEHWISLGWTKREDGKWLDPTGKVWSGISSALWTGFDGPGTFPSISGFFDQAAKNVGADIGRMKGAAMMLRAFITKKLSHVAEKDE